MVANTSESFKATHSTELAKIREALQQVASAVEAAVLSRFAAALQTAIVESGDGFQQAMSGIPDADRLGMHQFLPTDMVTDFTAVRQSMA